MPSSRRSSFSTTRRLAVLRGMIGHLDPVQPRASRRRTAAPPPPPRASSPARPRPGRSSSRRRRSGRAPLDGRQGDLAGEAPLDEDPEAEPRPELTLPLAHGAPGGEARLVLGRQRGALATRLPGNQPVAAAGPDLEPGLVVAARRAWPDEPASRAARASARPANRATGGRGSRLPPKARANSHRRMVGHRNRGRRRPAARRRAP